MDIFTRSLKISSKLFLVAREEINQPQFHFSFLFRKNKLISLGMNDYKIDNKALYFAERFNLKDKKEFPTIHSEISAISKLWGKYRLSSRIRIVNVRFTKSGNLGKSKPCPDCYKTLLAIGINEIYWSELDGTFSSY